MKIINKIINKKIIIGVIALLLLLVVIMSIIMRPITPEKLLNNIIKESQKTESITCNIDFLCAAQSIFKDNTVANASLSYKSFLNSVPSKNVAMFNGDYKVEFTKQRDSESNTYKITDYYKDGKLYKNKVNKNSTNNNTKNNWDCTTLNSDEMITFNDIVVLLENMKNDQSKLSLDKFKYNIPEEAKKHTETLEGCVSSEYIMPLLNKLVKLMGDDDNFKEVNPQYLECSVRVNTKTKHIQRIWIDLGRFGYDICWASDQYKFYNNCASHLEFNFYQSQEKDIELPSEIFK